MLISYSSHGSPLILTFPHDNHDRNHSDTGRGLKVLRGYGIMCRSSSVNISQQHQEAREGGLDLPKLGYLHERGFFQKAGWLRFSAFSCFLCRTTRQLARMTHIQPYVKNEKQPMFNAFHTARASIPVPAALAVPPLSHAPLQHLRQVLDRGR